MDSLNALDAHHIVLYGYCGASYVMILLVLSLIVLTLILRVLPILVTKTQLGVDHWFWKTYIETYKKNKVFPPELPQYLLDVKQWYPPVFPLLISHIPRLVFDKFSFVPAILIDLVRLFILLCFMYYGLNLPMIAIAVTGVVYATYFLLIIYNIQLNPRGLGAIFLDSIVVLLLGMFQFKWSCYVLIIVFILSGLILLTHKMTTQLFWFLCIGASIIFKSWHVLLLLPASVLSALILSRGFYFKVFVAHLDIVFFWNRNWRLLMAHPLKESPLYGDEGYETPGKIHKRGFSGLKSHLKGILYFDCWWPLMSVMIIWNWSGASAGSIHVCFVWATLIIVWALGTIFVPFLKCLGYGEYYFYNVAFPIALLWGFMAVGNEKNSVYWVILAMGLILNIWATIRYCIGLTKSTTEVLSTNLKDALMFLRDADKGVVMCLPPQLYDLVAYQTKKNVLFGAHGYGFEKLEPTFPVIRMPIPNIVSKYDIRYLLTIDGYLVDRFKNDLPPHDEQVFGEYIVYCFVAAKT
jgi:hypothetical protein